MGLIEATIQVLDEMEIDEFAEDGPGLSHAVLEFKLNTKPVGLNKCLWWEPFIPDPEKILQIPNAVYLPKDE